MGIAVVVVVRLLVPLLILRRPLLGGVLALTIDTLDLVVFNVLGFPPADATLNYQHLDKLLDLYYLTLELWIARRFAPLERGVSFALFAWRLAGVVLFEVTGARWILLVFPNLFELFWLLVVARGTRPPLTPRAALAWCAVLLVPKLAHEYLLHVWQVLDRYVLFDLIRDAWPW